jgi:hypothetical protein
MTEIVIKPREWRPFCERFTHKHRGWLVTVSQGSSEARTESGIISDRVPLRAVAVRRDRGGALVSIALGREGSRDVHTIQRPVLLRLEQTKDRADRALTIRSADGELTRMRFVTPHYGSARSPRRNDRTGANTARASYPRLGCRL